MAEFTHSGIRNGVATLVLDRPSKRNALGRAMIREINTFLEAIADDDSVRLMVLKAEGTVFCAGMDLAEMQSRAQAADPEREWKTDSDVYHELVRRILELPFPTLAVLQGPVLAGGAGLVFACDLVLASDNAFLALSEPKRGIVAAMVAPLLLRKTSLSVANYLLMNGKPVPAADALVQGLWNEVVPAAELEQAKIELVDSILTGSNTALRMTKMHLGRLTCSADLLAQLQDAAVMSAEARKSADAREGLAAFQEKRKPSWQWTWQQDR